MTRFFPLIFLIVFTSCLLSEYGFAQSPGTDTSGSGTTGSENHSSERPNIIFLLADDQCTYSLGCYGNQDVRTPHLDQLASDGVLFDRHYNTTAICMASRSNVLTGMYEYKTGCNFTHGDMHPQVWAKSYPILLREAGYLTAFAGKLGLEVEGKGLCQDDFDFWGGSPGQTCLLYTSDAADE